MDDESAGAAVRVHNKNTYEIKHSGAAASNGMVIERGGTELEGMVCGLRDEARYRTLSARCVLDSM